MVCGGIRVDVYMCVWWGFWGDFGGFPLCFVSSTSSAVVRAMYVCVYIAGCVFLCLHCCRRSSKNRRKTERKKRSMKEGSLHEDVALMDAVSELACTADRMQGVCFWGKRSFVCSVIFPPGTEEVGSLLRLLALYDYMALASSLQSEFAALMGVVRDGIPRVWKSASSVVCWVGCGKCGCG